MKCFDKLFGCFSLGSCLQAPSLTALPAKEGTVCKRLESSLQTVDNGLPTGYLDKVPFLVAMNSFNLFAMLRLFFSDFKESIYGKRDGTLSGLLIVSKTEKYNIFRATKAFKQGALHGIQMLPRSGMWKPEVRILNVH